MTDKLLKMYQALEEKEAKEHYRSMEHCVYHQVVMALQYPTLSPHMQYLDRIRSSWLADSPIVSLHNLIKREQERLEEKEEMYRNGLYIGDPQRFREYYQREIVLLEQAVAQLMPEDQKKEQ